MTTIYLVRHGDVAGNSGDHRTFAGWTDLPLTERGLAQMAEVARRLKGIPLDAVYASTLQRAWMTADAIAAEHGLTVARQEGWKEVNYGEWEGLSEDQIAERYGDLWTQRVANPANVSPPGGENYDALWLRLQPAWEGLISAHPNQSVAVVGHNGSLRVLLCYLMGAPFANARRMRIGNCSVTKIMVEEGEESQGQPTAGKLETSSVVIEYINNNCHLEGI